MIEIPLSQGQVAWIDDEDFPLIAEYKWSAQWNPKTKSYYAFTSIKDEASPKRCHLLMHRVILGTLVGVKTDHRDHDTLNNQRYNLRNCTNTQNAYNQRKNRGVSRFKGVTWHKQLGKWRAQIQFNRKCIHLGVFDDEIAAAQAYDRKAAELFGEFAYLNKDLIEGKRG